ncbi:general odorant-binding protein 83a-like [Anopheles darlingi]|uniref:general odorant-binding protein 83a-like n=1 Tax=Anopheles darlingi TaxID=43151 RepID=UPI0021003EEB|nr:general odorant-binding protein 83a-like [Anopheles darlingi]
MTHARTRARASGLQYASKCLLIGAWCVVLYALCAGCQRTPPRRDDTYPPPDTLEFYKPYAKQCIAETGVSVAAVKRFSDEDVFEDDQKLKCYMECMFRVSNLTDSKGEVHLGKLLETIKPEFEDLALRMGAKCMKTKGKDLCERAFWYHKCWKMSDPVHYYLIGP